MKIWICRHGETDLNKQHRIQGILDIPLNEEGLRQAISMRERLGDMRFDAVYSSPLERARKTACAIGGVTEEELIIDPRIIEVDFGVYDGLSYLPGPPEIDFFWLLPWFFSAPDTVETTSSMKARAASFIKDLETKDYENVLISSHGGIIRALSGYLENRPSKLRWYPKPLNCEIRVYELKNGKYKKINDLKTHKPER